MWCTVRYLYQYISIIVARKIPNDNYCAIFRDEVNLCSTADDENEKEMKNKVRALFERAINDYLSFDVWLEYAQWSCGEADFEQTRQVLILLFYIYFHNFISVSL